MVRSLVPSYRIPARHPTGHLNGRHNRSGPLSAGSGQRSHSAALVVVDPIGRPLRHLPNLSSNRMAGEGGTR